MSDCAALLLFGMMTCERCALSFDPDDPSPPACKPLTLDRMSVAFESIADEIEQSQRALKAANLRQHSHHGQLERAQLLRAGVRLLDRIKSDGVLRERLKAKPQPKDSES